jgi:hypothetical protein
MSLDHVEVKKESLTLERIALAAAVALLSWNVYTTNQLSISQAVSSAQLGAISEQIKSSAGLYATRGDVLVLQGALDGNRTRFENWLARLGDRLNAVEEEVTKIEERLEIIQ